MRSSPFTSALFVLASAALSQAARADEPPAPAAAPAPDSAAAPAPAPDSAAAPAPAPAPNLGEPPPIKGAPRLHIEADRAGVRLLRIERSISNDMGEGLLVRTACEAPCDRVVDGRKKQTFFLAAEGMVPSQGFQLAPLDGDITARVNGGSFFGRQLGYLFAGFGGVGLLGGAVLLGTGYASDAKLSGDGKIQAGANTGLQTAGFVTLGVGAALAVTGIVLVLTSKTSVTLLQGNGKTGAVRIEGGRILF